MSRPPQHRDSPFIPQAQSGGAPQPQRGGAKFNKLNALFGGGGAPAATPNPRVEASGMGAVAPRIRMEQLRAAQTVDAITSAVDALLAHHQMPDDPELLWKMLRHPDAGVGERALAELGALHSRGKLAVTPLAKEALEAFEPRCREPLARNLLTTMLGR